METIPVTKNIPKDSKEFVDFITAIARHFIQKKSWGELMATLPMAISAVDGWENVVASVKGQYLGETVGYMVGEMVELLEKKDDAPQ